MRARWDRAAPRVALSGVMTARPSRRVVLVVLVVLCWLSAQVSPRARVAPPEEERDAGGEEPAHHGGGRERPLERERMRER